MTSSEIPFEAPATDLNVETPKPLKWHILVRPLPPRKHSDAGIEFTEKTQQDQEFVTQVGQIVAMGERAYEKASLADSNNPGIGDWVLYPTNAGTRIELADGRVFNIMNDDAVQAVVDDPEMYRKKIV